MDKLHIQMKHMLQFHTQWDQNDTLCSSQRALNGLSSGQGPRTDPLGPTSTFRMPFLNVLCVILNFTFQMAAISGLFCGSKLKQSLRRFLILTGRLSSIAGANPGKTTVSNSSSLLSAEYGTVPVNTCGS